eukprot:EG_transcript_15700
MAFLKPEIENHQNKERHFRLVSKAYLALSCFALFVGVVSLSKGVNSFATSLQVRPVPTTSRTVPGVAQPTVQEPPTFARRASASPEDLNIVHVLPSREPDAVKANNTLFAGSLVMTLVAGLVYIFGRKPQPQQALPPLGPVPNYAMLAAGEEPVLLNRPTRPAAPEPSPAPTYVTVEFQRRQAKALLEHFEALEQAELAKTGRKLGMTPSNEITNGRWVMFGWLVGMMTEYATGVSFVEQIKLTLNNLAILDLD